MDFSIFFKGLAIGLSIAAPVGPIGVLCIRRSLTDGPLAGFVVGLGAATADAAYGCVAAFGLSAISSFLISKRLWLGLLGGTFLCFLGAGTFLKRPAEQPAATRVDGLLRAYFSTLLLTLTNPTTILSFVAVFAGFRLVASPDYLSAGILVLGVLSGSALWWFVLSSGVGWLRSRMNSSWVQAINRLSGCVIFTFGLYALARSVSK